MTKEYKLYSGKNCPLTPIYSAVCGLSTLKVKQLDIKDLPKEINLPTESSFVLHTGSNLIWTKMAIFKYIALMSPSSFLYGEKISDQPIVDTWLEWFQDELAVPLHSVILPKLGLKCSKITTDPKAADSIPKSLEILDSFLVYHTYLAGNRLTIADIIICMTLHMSKHFGVNIPSKLQNLERLMKTVLAMGPVSNALKSMPKASEGTACAAKSDNTEEKQKKKDNPLDSLPPSKMHLDEWKRTYSNTKDLIGVAMPWFWTNYDSAGYSLWYMKYAKLEGELDVAFRASNMLGGFLQRIDNNFRKYSFGVINVVGSGKEFDYQGVWLFRGNQIPQDMQEHPSFEYHTFRKLDLSNASDKKLVEDYWCNDDSVEGLPINDCKVWK